MAFFSLSLFLSRTTENEKCILISGARKMWESLRCDGSVCTQCGNENTFLQAVHRNDISRQQGPLPPLQAIVIIRTQSTVCAIFCLLLYRLCSKRLRKKWLFSPQKNTKLASPPRFIMAPLLCVRRTKKLDSFFPLL